jgi:hypothetical protein
LDSEHESEDDNAKDWAMMWNILLKIEVSQCKEDLERNIKVKELV